MLELILEKLDKIIKQQNEIMIAIEEIKSERNKPKSDRIEECEKIYF